MTHFRTGQRPVQHCGLGAKCSMGWAVWCGGLLGSSSASSTGGAVRDWCLFSGNGGGCSGSDGPGTDAGVVHQACVGLLQTNRLAQQRCAGTPSLPGYPNSSGNHITATHSSCAPAHPSNPIPLTPLTSSCPCTAQAAAGQPGVSRLR